MLGPDKTAVAGAKVYFHFLTHQDEPISARATSDANGRFSFTLNRKDVPLTAVTQFDPLQFGHVIVKADGYAVTWLWLFGKKPASDLILRLAKDTAPIEGRVLDLEGKPLAGLRVSVQSAWASEDGDLTKFIEQSKSGESIHNVAFKTLPNFLGTDIKNGRNLSRVVPSTTTGADGRFVNVKQLLFP